MMCIYRFITYLLTYLLTYFCFVATDYNLFFISISVVCLSVCLSVHLHLDITYRYRVKMTKHVIRLLSLLVSLLIIIFKMQFCYREKI